MKTANKKIKWNSIPCDYWEFKSLTGVVIIPVKDKNPAPVLIFKDYGAPFYREYTNPKEVKDSEELDAENNYVVYWKNQIYMHCIPKCVERQYGDFFNKIIEKQLPTYYDINNFPEGCVEIPIHLLKSKSLKITGKLESKIILNQVKDVLRKWEFLPYLTGKIKPPDRIREKRNLLIFKNVSDLEKGKIKRYGFIKDIKDEITKFLLKLDLPQNKYDKCILTETQIWRIIKKEEKRKKEFEKWLHDNVPL